MSLFLIYSQNSPQRFMFKRLKASLSRLYSDKTSLAIAEVSWGNFKDVVANQDWTLFVTLSVFTLPDDQTHSFYISYQTTC